jgi:2-keto-4-pentenoate hydratase/2-oxohepta-3-ene-1,7-dioic acid hydratase in catechol pathway
MRYITFFESGGRPRPALLDGQDVRPLPEAIPTLIDYIALAPEARRDVEPGPALPLARVTLDAPVRPAKNIFCVGRNYLAHAEEGARARGVELKLPDVPTFFTKAPTAIVGPDATLALAAEVSPEYDWEAELAVVIARRCRDVREAEALEVVFGYTALNDVTARDLQRAHLQWFKGKTLDQTCPLGPWIVGTDELPDPHSLQIRLRLNGETKQDSNTRLFIFDIPRVIAQLSRGMTLEPGDVIATGTPDGVGYARKPPEFLKDGDVMEVEIEKIGILRNRVRISSRVGIPA